MEQKQLELTTKSEFKPPTLPELMKDRAMALEQTALSVMLNAQPPAAWLKKHPLIQDYHYLPIERVEWLLTRIFTAWRFEIMNIYTVANSVVITGRLHYFDPYVTNDWQWMDGVGAAPIQTNKGAGATDWNAVKTDGVQKAAPAAESYAIKDAAEKLGRIFGKDLNRKEVLNYESNYDKFRDSE